MKILLSGEPGVGKSTSLKKIVNDFEEKRILGCIVEEIRGDNGCRDGFCIKYIPSGNQTRLASRKDVLSSQYISKFSVNIDAIEKELIPYIERMATASEYDFLIFDEIGRMQHLSPKFLEAIDKIVESNIPLIATIVYDNDPWARKYKENEDFFHIIVTKHNRDFIPNLLKEMLSSSYENLDKRTQKKVHHFFHTYIAENRILELLKLFKNSIHYVIHQKAIYNHPVYLVSGHHGLKTVSVVNGYSCTCDFYQQSKNVDCSHIQTVKLLTH